MRTKMSARLSENTIDTIKSASRRPPGRGAGGSVQPVSRRPWCSGTIKRVCPQVDPQARSYNGSVRISAAGSGSVDPTCVVQLKYASCGRGCAYFRWTAHARNSGMRISAERSTSGAPRRPSAGSVLEKDACCRTTLDVF